MGKAANPQDARDDLAYAAPQVHEPGAGYDVQHCRRENYDNMLTEKFNYKSTRWRRLAAKAMRRDGYMCQLSARYGRSVPAEVVHHIYPVDEYPEYAYCLWNLISLSRAAHNKLHDRENNKLTAEGVALMRRTRKP